MAKLLIAGLAAFVLCATGAVSAFADEASTLTRQVWMSKVGTSASDQSVLKNTLPQLAAADRAEFANRVLKAVSRLPISPEEKAEKFVQVANDLLAQQIGDQKADLIAEIYATTPVEFLPAVTDSLSQKFSPEKNGLSNAAYEKFAETTMDKAAKLNAGTDEPSVRDTMVALLFMKGAPQDAELKNKLLSKMPDDHTRQVANDLIPGVLSTGKYDDVLKAAGIDDEPLDLSTFGTSTGHSALDRLLDDISAVQSVGGANGESGSNNVVNKTLENIAAGDGSTDFDVPSVGLNRIPTRTGTSVSVAVPRGYQNQNSAVIYEDIQVEVGVNDNKRRKHNNNR
ncbi:MAG: hypothetical protein IJU44_00390 [Kiritimatiellae bacterium]|nr:hypothetical protein [Kiritimatiellia bacterium]